MKVLAAISGVLLIQCVFGHSISDSTSEEEIGSKIQPSSPFPYPAAIGRNYEKSISKKIESLSRSKKTTTQHQVATVGKPPRFIVPRLARTVVVGPQPINPIVVRSTPQVVINRLPYAYSSVLPRQVVTGIYPSYGGISYIPRSYISYNIPSLVSRQVRIPPPPVFAPRVDMRLLPFAFNSAVDPTTLFAPVKMHAGPMPKPPGKGSK